MSSGKQKIDITGKRFGQLVVIKFACVIKKKIKWLCKCDCGKEAIIDSYALRHGITSNCGCESRIGSPTHGATRGHKRIPEYNAWCNMKARCYNKKHPEYKNYGERGIRVCNRWVNSFEHFISDMGIRPSSEHSLDRHPDSDGNYLPNNCRWATDKQQCRNKRIGGNILITINNETKCLSEWAEASKLSRGTISWRLEHKWPSERLLETPLESIGQKHPMSKLTEEQVVEIKKKLKNGNTLMSIAKEYNVDFTNISAIKRGKTWKFVQG